MSCSVTLQLEIAWGTYICSGNLIMPLPCRWRRVTGHSCMSSIPFSSWKRLREFLSRTMLSFSPTSCITEHWREHTHATTWIARFPDGETRRELQCSLSLVFMHLPVCPFFCRSEGLNYVPSSSKIRSGPANNEQYNPSDNWYPRTLRTRNRVICDI